jgi:hypothetical protein
VPVARKILPNAYSVIVLAVVPWCLSCSGSFGGPSAGRYSMATDPASRYAFRYVRDRQTGLWVHRECEARVSANRRLPDPISDPETGDRLHSQRFEPETVGSGDLVPAEFTLVDGWRVWRFRHLPSEADLEGRSAWGVQVEWPKRGGPSDWEPMETFTFPAIAPMVPDVWSAWTTAASQRAGAFGWWEEVHGSPPEPSVPIPYPFELRCRLLLKDHLYVD